MRIVGVDPGALGALALLCGGRLTDVFDMPVLHVRRGKTDKAEVDGYALADLIRQLNPDILIVELVGGFTGQSASAAFNFGDSAGAPKYIAQALGIRVERVPPTVWKRSFKLRGGKDDSRAMAMRYWPAHAAAFRRVKDDGRAEAALIAEWGRRQFVPPAHKEIWDGERAESVFG